MKLSIGRIGWGLELLGRKSISWSRMENRSAEKTRGLKKY
jgi:hypothetical protein